MKKSKTTKLLAVALSALLILTMALGISVLANENEQDVPEIVSKNVMYGDVVYFMFAVPKTTSVTSENTVINFYTENPDEVTGAKSITFSPYGSQTINGVDCITFVTGGVPLQHIAEYVYARPVSGNTEGELIRYSILEYLYERLYTCKIDPLQEAHYNATLNYGIAAQANLINKGKNPGDEGYKTPIGDLNYVYVDKAMGTLDGKNFSGLYVDGTKLTLTLDAATKPAAGYGITNIVDGESTHKKFKDTAITVKNTAIIGEFVFDGETFEAINHPYATASAAGNVNLNGQSHISAWLPAGEGFGISKDPANSANNVLQIDRTQSSLFNLYITPETVAPNGNAVVFEADLRFDFTTAEATYLEFSNAGNIAQQVIFGTSGDYMTVRLNKTAPVIDGISNKYFDTTAKKGEWFNFRMEYYVLDEANGVTRTAIYINDNLVQLFNHVYGSTVYTAFDKLTVKPAGSAYYDMYMDNMAFRKVNKEFVQPALDFEDGNLPSEIRTSTWGSATGDNTIEQYVDDGKLVVKTETGNRTNILFSATENYKAVGNEIFNTWVFESDITILGTTGGADSAFAFKDSNGNEYRMKMNIAIDENYMWFQPYSGGGSQGSLSGAASIQNGKEYHLRLEYFLNADGKATISFIINGTTVKTITDTSIANVPTIDAMGKDSFIFDIGTNQAADFTFDNVKFFPTYIERN